MKITSRFTVAVHTLLVIYLFGGRRKTTSEFIADSVQVNPVVIRRTLLSLKAAGMVEVKAGSGCVISTSSIGGLMGVANQADYCASKAGLIGMTRALAMEFGKQGIRFNCICPGMIWTDMLRGVNQD